MTDAVFFSGLDCLESQELRLSVIRIPEILVRIRQAQEVLDKNDVSIDLSNFIASDDTVFLRNIRMKSLVSAIVQVGLYDRYLRFYSIPQYLFGNSNGDSALEVCVGLSSFEEMVSRSAAICADRRLQVVPPADGLPVLSGISLTEFAVYRVVRIGPDANYVKIDADAMNLGKIVETLIEDCRVRRVIHVGPGQNGNFGRDLRVEELEMLESIDMDPMLSWFWRNVREISVVGAN